jgi:hypothetical protein
MLPDNAGQFCAAVKDSDPNSEDFLGTLSVLLDAIEPETAVGFWQK